MRDRLTDVLTALGDGPPREVIAGFVAAVESDALVAWLLDVADHQTDDVLAMYDRMASTYEAAFPERSHVEDSLSLIGDRQVERGLDIGCGTGKSTAALLAHAASVIGVDGSANMLRLAERAVPKAHFVQADFTKTWPVGTASIDLLLSVGATRHLPHGSEPAFYAECARVLRPGADAVLTFVTPKSGLVREIDALLCRFFSTRGIVDRRFEADVTRSELSAAGLRIVGERVVQSDGLYDKWFVRVAR